VREPKRTLLEMNLDYKVEVATQRARYSSLLAVKRLIRMGSSIA